MVAGKTYRNKKMIGVDFYATKLYDDYVEGYWILRSNGAILGDDKDEILRSRVKPEDWQEV